MKMPGVGDRYSPTDVAEYYEAGCWSAETFPDLLRRQADAWKDIVIRGGMNISVREIEDLLAGHPAIRSAAVVAMPDERLGERVCCYIVPADPSDPPALDDLTAYLTERGIAIQKSPEHLEVIDEMPTTATGKIQKHLLRKVTGTVTAR